MEKRTEEERDIIDQITLWPHQSEAIACIQGYLHDYNSKITDKSALIQMPTGSGKSGVIASIARCIQNVGLVLVLTPRVSLRDQLLNDINGRFFNHVSYPTENLLKRIESVAEGSSLNLKGNIDDLVLVMTIDMLLSISKFYFDSFSILKEKVSLLIVDEGHYEPAKEWSRVIRDFNTPKVIFTATPYRNDFKAFDIDTRYAFTMSFKNACEKRFLRQVKFVNRDSNVRKTPAEFVDDVIRFYDSKYKADSEDPPRVIIRCDDSASIRQLANAFKTKDRTVVGIHETFSEVAEGWERKKVPNPEIESAIFWIHQNKLLEGIDDSRFCMLAIYKKISSARDLIQQIGRIIRNPKREEGWGYVLEYWDGFHECLWNGFLKYDEAIDKFGIEAFDLVTGNGMLPKLMELQPKLYYIDRRFRSKFNIASVDPLNDIQLPLRTNLLKKLSSFKIKEYVKHYCEEFINKDRRYEEYFMDNTTVIISISCNNSAFLVNHVFIEADINLTIIREFADFISIYDSTGIILSGDDIGIGNSINTEKLKKLFSQGKGAKITTVSLSNTNLGTSVIRSRVITAASIEATIPSFDDYAQVCTTAEGYSIDNATLDPKGGTVRRYVGFSRGRIAQSSTGYKPLCEYLKWLEEIQKVLDEDRKPIAVLSRYSLEEKEPKDTEPRNILLDLEDVKDKYVYTWDESKFIEIKDLCANIEKNKCIIEANGQKVEAEVKFKHGKYQIISSDLESCYYSNDESLPMSIIQYLNNTQSFRIIPKDVTSIYVQGKFYDPLFNVGRKFNAKNYDLGYCFFPDNKIGLCNSEKGSDEYYEKAEEFDPKSLFGIISSCGSTTSVEEQFGDPNIIICDDNGTESADFILCNTISQKVIFIHAKATNDHQYCSASSLHEVCSQAVKNLCYLSPYNKMKPSKIGTWNKKWRGKVNRICKIDTLESGEKIWSRIRSVITNPQADKEVWLVLGNILSKKHFERSLSEKNPLPHIIQAAFLLKATMSDVGSIGAKLKIFCEE